MHARASGGRRARSVGGNALVFLMLAAAVAAQPAGDAAVTSVAVPGAPEGIVNVTGFTAWNGARAGLFPDLVRHLYAAPDADSPAVRAVRRHAGAVTGFMEAWRAVRAAEGTASLAHAGERRARRRLEDLVEAAGLRLRRSSGVYRVRIDDGDDARARRASLRDAGLAVDDMDRRLNDGEALSFELPSFHVPLPLTAAVWQDVVLRSPGRDDPLLGLRILADRRAALLYHGLLSMPADTRRFLAANPRLLRDLYEDHAETLALYGRSLAVAGDRVAVPGGPEAETLWRSLTSERVDRPDDFIRAVLSRDDRTLAYFYDFVAHLDDARRRFVLNLWVDEGRRRSRWWRFYDVFLAQPRVLPERPFNRTYPDPSLLMAALAVHPSGEPAPPAWRGLWEEVFSGTDLPGNPERDVRGVTETELVDAGWLAERVFERAERVDDRVHVLAFAQRRFPNAAAAELPDVLVALRGFSRFRALVLTLDRMGVRRAAVYAAAVRRAARIDTISDPERRARVLSQFQGALAVVDRLRYAGALTDEGAESLAASASAVELDRDREYAGGMAAWVADVLVPALGTESGRHSAPKEQVVLEALAGRRADGEAPPRVLVPWEGYDYVADLEGATLARLAAARRAQAGNSLDVALELSAVAARMASGPDMLDAVHAAARDLESLDGRLRERAETGSVTVADYLSRARRDLQAIREPRRVDRAVDAGRRLLRLADAVVGDALRSLAYAGLVGDPSSGVLDGGDLAARHDFGVRIPDGDARRRAAWRLPVARAGDRPWYGARGAARSRLGDGEPETVAGRHHHAPGARGPRRIRPAGPGDRGDHLQSLRQGAGAARRHRDGGRGGAGAGGAAARDAVRRGRGGVGGRPERAPPRPARLDAAARATAARRLVLHAGAVLAGLARGRGGRPRRAARLGRSGVARHRLPVSRDAGGRLVGTLDRRPRQRHRTDPDPGPGGLGGGRARRARPAGDDRRRRAAGRDAPPA